MPNDDVGKMLFCKSVPLDRLCCNKRTFGTLKGIALRKARRIVNKYGAINRSGIYGSIEIDEKVFIPYDNKE